jgi:hypothetical protein
MQRSITLTEQEWEELDHIIECYMGWTDSDEWSERAYDLRIKLNELWRLDYPGNYDE